MAKPILVIEVPIKLDRDVYQTRERIAEHLTDYHVFVVMNDQITGTAPVFKTFNDCSGLPDDDIKKLIDEYYRPDAT